MIFRHFLYDGLGAHPTKLMVAAKKFNLLIMDSTNIQFNKENIRKRLGFRGRKSKIKIWGGGEFQRTRNNIHHLPV